VRSIDHWINGALVPSGSGRSGPVFNPATGEQQASVGLASIEEVDAAVAAAKAAFPAWRNASLSKRAEVMFRFRDLVVTHRDEIAELVSSEHGKVPSDAAGELARGIENIEFACGIPAMMKGGYSEGVSGGVDVYSIKQPLGVVAGITPFNFPAMVPMWMFAIADLLKQAGLPDGVFNVLQGDKTAVDRILDHPDIEAVSFVGSTPIAQYIYSTGTANGKRVQALGGAKNHMVVLPDADINMAADAAVSAAYGSAGERCMAISVVVAVGGVGDRLIDAVTERLPKLKVGPGTDPNAEMGPLITREHRDKVASYLAGAPAEGATVVVDGREADLPTEGFFLGVSLIDHVKPGMKSYDDEIFGPVLSVVRVDTYDEAVDLINRHQYGNGTAIFTRDGGAAKQFQYDIKVGMVGINVPIPVPVAYYSFGGWKASIFGDSNIYGPAGVEFYTRTKTVTSRWPDPATSTVDLGFPRTR
jgi:malonate-semialdehyde dehydrogenase (acetylating)/methylmalonate-semialdehyde dehydrogenase